MFISAISSSVNFGSSYNTAYKSKKAVNYHQEKETEIETSEYKQAIINKKKTNSQINSLSVSPHSYSSE